MNDRDGESSEIGKRVNGYEKEKKFNRTRRHLQVNSVIFPERKEDVDWNRKAHSSPIKGYRRFSGQEFDDTSQVCENFILSVRKSNMWRRNY